MTQLEQTFYQTTPTHLVGIEVELGRLNENISRLITLLENEKTSSKEGSVLYDSLLLDSPLNSSRKAAKLLRKELSGLDHEEVYVVFLKSDMKPIRKELVNIGTLTSTQMDIRRIIKQALDLHSTSIILYHNHPSANPTPSKMDIKHTEELRDSLQLFDIKLTDHIIIGEDSFYSFADEEVKKFK